ncbi:MAG: hypothetical protein WB783_10110 [Arenicellales bacterium]
MVLYVGLILSAAFSLIGLINWRQGIFCMILLAAVQDPIRKLAPGAPAYLILITTPILIAALVKGSGSVPGWWQDFKRFCPRVSQSYSIFALFCLPAAYISFTYGPGTWMVTLLGIASYSVVLFSIVAGFHFSRSGLELRRVVAFYVLAHGLMLSGSLIQFFDLADWRIVGDEALGFQWARYAPGYVVHFISGFYRSGDVMGWHAAAVCCLAMTLAVPGRERFRWLWIGIAVLALFALLVCGRRKMVYVLPIFISCFVVLYWLAGRGGRRMRLLAIVAITIGVGFFFAQFLGSETTFIRYYTDQSHSILQSVEKRGFDTVATTIRQAGFFGYGLGFATPGAHHLNVPKPHIWQEAGTSRLFAELGIPGAVAFIVLMLQILRRLWDVTQGELKAGSAYGIYCAGLLSFFVSNLCSLTVSGQILADPFILSWLGFLVGLLMGVVRLPDDPREDRYALAQAQIWDNRLYESPRT